MIKESKRYGNVALFVPHEGCPHQCSFCNQRHIAGKVDPLTPDQVVAACNRAAQQVARGRQMEIAFFGGSFTAIAREQMVALLQAAYPFVQQGVFEGIRVSTRPDAVNQEVLSLLRRYGVTTIELGAQSMDDAVLAENRRGHTAAHVETAARLIKDAGFRLGLQMMTGLPGDSDEGALQTAQRLAALQPDMVRIYPTLVIDHTPLAEQYRSGRYQPSALQDAIALCARLLAYFEDECDIRVIRLGLHDEEDMHRHYLAGPMHPAFRERCEARLLFERIRAQLPNKTSGAATVWVSPSRVSQAVGHKRENVDAFAAIGWNITVVADAALDGKDIRVEVIA